MPPHGQKQKRVEDKRSPEEISLEAAKNSPYNIFTPMHKAQHIRFRNPLTSLDKLYSVEDPAFYEVFYDFSKKGLEERLFNEIKSFISIDPAWENVLKSLEGYFKVKDLPNEAVKSDSQA